MKRFADRGFITVNGVELAELETLSANINENLRPVDTMTRNKRSSGYAGGNASYDLSLSLKVEKYRAQVDLALGNEDADIEVVVEIGGERVSFLSVVQNSIAYNSSVGDAGKTLNLLALDAVNENGASVNGAIQLG